MTDCITSAALHGSDHGGARCCLQVDQDNSGEIDFPEFCNVILKHKAATAKNQDEADTLDAFVALGGNVSSVAAGA